MKNVADIYPVSPMQEFMLLHAVTHGADDTLFNQFCYRIDQHIDTDAFQNAWQQILDRHAALRTGFVWDKVKQPMQVVRKSLSLPFELQDWRDRPAEQHERDLSRWCEDDRQRGFDPQRPPLMRVALMRRAKDAWYFVWSSHHLLLDRWCMGPIIADFNRFYAAGVGGQALATDSAASFRGYIQWIQNQDAARGEAFWRSSLAGLKRTTSISSAGPVGEASAAEVMVDAANLASLQRFARARGVTISTVVQAAWALVLNQLTGSQDVMFGAAVAGRPPDVPNVETIVGSFVNNVPVRVTLPAEETVFDLLTRMQLAQQRRSPFEYVSPVDIQRYSEVARGQPLFDSLLVWLAAEDDSDSRALPMQAISSDFATAYPFTLSIAQSDDGLSLNGLLRNSSPQDVMAMLTGLSATLHALVDAGYNTTLGDIADFRRDSEFNVLDLDSWRADTGAPAALAIEDDEEVQPGREIIDTELLTDFLRSEWEQILGTDAFSDDDDFFALGGDSLKAAELHQRIEAGTRQRIPLLSLYQGASLRKMAHTLASGGWSVKPGIAIGLREHGEGRPLFCIASAEVNTVGYSMLARHLDPQRRVYVLQAAPDTDQPRRMHPDELPGLATRYLAAMRAIQPSGPYDLLGMCGGAHIAVELTRAIEAHSERAAFLGIINTWGLYTVSRLYYVNRLTNIARYYYARLKKHGTRSNDTTSNENIQAQSTPPQKVVAEFDAGLDSPWIRDVGFSYRDPERPRIASPITVFRIQPQQYWRVRDQGLGWSRQSSDVRIVNLPGNDHNSILREPFVRGIAREIEALLHREPQQQSTAYHRPAITPAGNVV